MRGVEVGKEIKRREREKRERNGRARGRRQTAGGRKENEKERIWRKRRLLENVPRREDT